MRCALIVCISATRADRWAWNWCGVLAMNSFAIMAINNNNLTWFRWWRFERHEIFASAIKNDHPLIEVAFCFHCSSINVAWKSMYISSAVSDTTRRNEWTYRTVAVQENSDCTTSASSPMPILAHLQLRFPVSLLGPDEEFQCHWQVQDTCISEEKELLSTSTCFENSLVYLFTPRKKQRLDWEFYENLSLICYLRLRYKG